MNRENRNFPVVSRNLDRLFSLLYFASFVENTNLVSFLELIKKLDAILAGDQLGTEAFCHTIINSKVRLLLVKESTLLCVEKAFFVNSCDLTH